MNWKNIARYLKKEIQGAIRDRRTLISMIVVPLILSPSFSGNRLFFVNRTEKFRKHSPLIGITGAENSRS